MCIIDMCVIIVIIMIDVLMHVHICNIQAQLGCRVNAQSCRLSPVDRIFTRISQRNRKDMRRANEYL